MDTNLVSTTRGIRALAAAMAVAAFPGLGLGQLRPIPTATKLSVIAAPQGFTVAPTAMGPQLTWLKSPDATNYRVLRGAGSASAPTVIATLPVTALSYVDRGFAGSATYQVLTVASDGRTAASAQVNYSPPPPIPAPTARFVNLSSPIILGRDTIRLTGANLSPLTALFVLSGCHDAFLTYCIPGCSGNEFCYAGGGRGSISVSPLTASATGLTFIVPTSITQPNYASVPSGQVLPDPFFIVIRTQGGADTLGSLTLMVPR